MDSNSSDSEDTVGVSVRKLNQAKYAKVMPDGSIDMDRLQEEDYVHVKHFLQKAFPDVSRVQNELDQTLKRTFVLGRSNKVKMEASFNKLPKPKSKEIKLSKTKLRSLGLHKKDKKIPRRLAYEDFLELHSLWASYVAHLFANDSDVNEIQGKLNRIDLHGAYISVAHSNCASYEHLNGIVVKETKNTFVIVTSQNVPKTIPKYETVFDIKLENPSGVMRIVGNSFLTRPAERVSKKVKSFMDFVGPKVYRANLKRSQLC